MTNKRKEITYFSFFLQVVFGCIYSDMCIAYSNDLYIKTTKEDKGKVYAIHISGEMQPNKTIAVCNQENQISFH
jgi:hypothetical protein